MKSAILPSKREHVAVMRKATKVLLFISLSFLFTFTSCQNIFEDSVSDSESHTVQTDENNNQLPEQKQNGPAAPAAPVVIPKVSFKGSLNVNGALPEKMEKVLADPSIYDEEALEDENSSVFARLSRAARPKLPAVGSAYEYFVKATDQTGLAKEDVPHLDPDDNKYKYNLELEINKTWTFQAGFRKKAVGEEGDADYEPEKILLIDTETEVDNSYSKTLNEATVETTHNFVLKPMKTPDGKGKLQLLMETIPLEVTQLKLFIPDEDDGHAVPWLSDDILEVALHSSTSITSSTGVAVNNYIRSKDDAFNIPSGAYDVTLIFYKTVTGVTEPVPCYITCQTINIFDNMVTDSWINESGASADGAIDSTTGVFALSDTLMQNFLETTIYVGQLAGGTVSASDGNTGSAYSPLATLGRAFELIQVQGNGSPYRIYITGNQTGNFTIPSGIGTTQASSIEISGIGNTPSVLDGNKTGTVLKVDSAVPVTLKNIRITNGKAESGSPTSGKGGGIYIASGASVTLGTDAIIGGIPAGVTSAAISENSSSNYALSGGGVYCEGSLILKRGSEVSYNYASDSSFENGGGGGIRCKNGTLKIEDGSKISMNGSANAGAGIALEATDFIMTGGLVSDNRNNNSGGGIYNSACTRFVISGGVISGNHANTGGGLSISNGTTTESVISGNTLIEKNSSGSLGRGGGIYVSSGILNLQGVTIKNNTSVSTYPGGAVAVVGTVTLKISGSTYIPYGVATSTETGVSTETGPGKNDIYLDSGKTITLESDLSKHSSTDRIFVTLHADNWVRSTSVVTAATGFTITDTIKDKFGYTTAGWISSIESNTIKLDSPIYVKASGTESATGTSADPFDNIQHALSAMTDSNKDYVIYVDGTVTGSQTIPAENLSSFSARSITIEGVNNGTLDGQSCNSSVLTIEATCDVTIRNLTIKGAYLTTSSTHGGGILSNTSGKLILASGTTITENTCARDGGGVEKSYGTLEIQDGVEISRNTAGSGGGIATMNSATVIMSGGVIKGNKSTGNTSDFGGGGVYLNGGKFFIYGNALIGTDNASLTDYTVANDCNVANYGGGGICITASAAVYIGYKGLDSSDNPVLATGEEAFTGGIMGNYGAFYGGGIYDNFGTKLVIGAGKISNNKTATSGCGGAIFTSINTTLNTIIRGGEISGNIAGKGGAIYNNGTLKLEAGAKIPGAGTAGSNDILLNAVGTPLVQRFVTVCASTFTYHNTSNNPICLTLQTWKRGTKILEAADSSVTISTASNYFKLTDGGWNKTVYDSDGDGTNDSVKIESPIYVAGSDPRVCTGTPGHAAGTTGTTAHPFDSIEAACSLFTDDGAQYEIKIDGHVTGAQTIPDTIHGQSLTISGYDTTKGRHTINGNSSGSVLTINTAVPVRLQNLTIYGGGGTTAVNGGGINITKNGAKVGLINNIYVQKNQATAKGGGIYVCSGATLCLAGGTTYIGKESGSGPSDASTPLTDNINIAEEGGGIYSDGYIKFGYTISEAGIESGKSGNIYIYGNVATKNGGGLYYTDSLTTVGSTSQANNICYNYSGEKGGGIYAASTDTDTNKSIRYLSLENNKSAYGGGIYISSSSRYESSYYSITNNEATENGGGVYNEGYFELGDVYRTTVKSNKAKKGGAIYNAGTLELWNGTIGGSGENDPNTASVKGGAIYVSASSTINYNAGSGKYVDIQYGSAEKPNDIYLEKVTSGGTTTYATITISTSSLSSASGTITLADWKRGVPVLKKGTTAITDTIAGKFAFTESGWNNKVVDSGNGTQLDSPIYVAGTGAVKCTGTPADSDNTIGNSVHPFASISGALSLVKDKNTDYIIEIDGTVTGSQSIPDTLTDGSTGDTTYMAKSLLIQGTNGLDTNNNPKDSLNTGTTGKGRVLLMEAKKVPVTIKNLLITGSDISGNGGGIFVNNTDSTLILSDGAVVNGNKAENDGGIMLYNGSLFINGSAVVGKSGVSEVAQDAEGKYGNKATEKGGGIYVLNGTLWLGYAPGTTPAAKTTTGGVFYNLVSGSEETQGGGIYNANGTINFAKGKVAYNYACSTESDKIGCGGGITNCKTMNMSTDASVEGNASAYGGGIYLGKYSTSSYGALSMTGGIISSNQSKIEMNGSSAKEVSGNGMGGGVAVGYNASFTISAGEISSNTAEDIGGAVVHHGSLCEIKGTATIPCGTDLKNDIALWDGKIKASGATGHSGDGAIAITPKSWVRGTQVFTNDSYSTYFSKYKVSDSEWQIITHDSKGKIDADIYVASSLTTGHNRATGISAPSSTESERRGTMARPYSSISEAVNACWDADRDFTIHLSGIIEGSAQSIPAADTTAGTALAKSITLEGVQGNSKDVINRKLETATDSGTALTINTATPVTIKKIKITGGYNNASGGGIYASAAGASLTLSEGALVTANNLSVSGTTYTGAGVYIEGTDASSATFIMESDATISGNNAGSGGGGGVGLKYATLCMTGSALIGDKDATSAATGDSGKHSNSAQSGGGVYVGTGSKLRLGYATPTATTETSLDAAYGIRYNYVYNAGGGVLVAAGSSVEIASGSISCNGTIANAAYKNGGGIYLNETATLTMTGGTIAKNKAYDGGGVYLYGNTSTGSSIVMSGGTIGDSSKNKSPIDLTTIDYSNYAGNYGGGIYSASGSSVSISGGYVNFNWGDRGGGVYSSGSFAMTGGNISYNATNTGDGGGVYFNAGATLTSGTLQGNKSHNGGAIYIQSGKTVTINGALALTSNGSVLRGNLTTQGGAIYNGGTLNITGAATFTGNSANGSTSGDAYGGAIFNAGGLTISAGASINNNSATASGSGKSAYGGAIYNYGTLTMSAGSVGTTTMNTVTSSGTSGVAQGGAIYQGGSFIVSGSINLYNSSNVATKNDVYLPDSEKRVVLNGKLTNSNTTVMKLTPNSYTFGAYVVEKGGSINESNFKSSLEKIGLIPSGIYSGVAYSSNNYSAGATTWTGYRGVVGIDFNSITENQIKSYTFGSVQQDYAGGVHYILLKNSSGKYGAIEFNVARTNASNGTITAKYVVFNSSRETGNLSSVTYTTGSYMMGQALINWKPFGNDDAASLMWDGTSIVMYVATSYNNMTGHWLY